MIPIGGIINREMEQPQTNNLHLARFLNTSINVEPPNGDRKWIKPKYCLFLQGSRYCFYPVMEFYKNKGIKGIYIESKIISNMDVALLRDLGTTKLNNQQIMDMMKESLRVQSLDAFYSMIYITIATWVKYITEKDVTVLHVPYNEYFGIEISNIEDERKSIEQEEIENNIRQQFTLPLFTEEDPTDSFTCCVN